MPKSPVFIVGSPRSGTSILVSALTSVGYRGYHEGNFLPLMQLITSTIDQHFAASAKPNPHILVAQIDPQTLKERIQAVFKELTDSLNTAPLWFDKSGNHGMIWAIPTLLRLWPTSVFIFAKRRGIENVVSRVKKFPARDFEYHCADWARNMAAWRAVREQLPEDIHLEVDQQELVRNTESISTRISEFLGLGDQQLEHIIKTFRSRRPQESTKGSAIQTYALDSVGWSETQLAIFNKQCDQEMKAYGYGTGSDYYL
jgi:hypothetical protein